MSDVLVTYSDIISSVREKLGIQSTDTLAVAKISRIINEIYQDEVVPFKQWMWLQKNAQIVHNKAYITGTVSVTQGSATVTLSTAPTGLSFLNYVFSVDDSDSIYPITAHTTSATTFTLAVPFQEASNSAQTFKIWRDRIDLPLKAKETVNIWHAQRARLLEGVGPQEYRKITARLPKLDGPPTHYSTYDYFDPSTSTDQETISDRYRQTRIYPAINLQDNIVLNVDYIEYVDPLNDDADEPLMPVGDRIVLFYGACSMAYSALLRNEDMADRYWVKFQAKLARMAGEREEGQDTPKLRPSPNYVNKIRKAGLRRTARRRWW